MQFIPSCFWGTWTPPWKSFLMIETLSPSKSPRIHQINNTNNSIHLTHRCLWNLFLSCYAFSLLLVLSSSIWLFISSEISFSGNLSLRNFNTTQPQVFYSFWFLSTYLKKLQNHQNKKTPNQLNKMNQQKNPQTKTKWSFLFKLFITFWRLSCNTGGLFCYRIICKDDTEGPKWQNSNKIITLV